MKKLMIERLFKGRQDDPMTGQHKDRHGPPSAAHAGISRTVDRDTAFYIQYLVAPFITKMYFNLDQTSPRLIEMYLFVLVI